MSERHLNAFAAMETVCNGQQGGCVFACAQDCGQPPTLMQKSCLVNAVSVALPFVFLTSFQCQDLVKNVKRRLEFSGSSFLRSLARRGGDFRSLEKASENLCFLNGKNGSSNNLRVLKKCARLRT